MTSPRKLYFPSPDACFGRAELCGEILSEVLDRGSALLFGGRQSGKTTILMRLAMDLQEAPADDEFPGTEVGVYCDLMRMRPEGPPSAVFGMLAEAARIACGKQFRGFRLEELPSRRASTVPSVKTFEEDLAAIIDSTEVDATLVFLVDETKRILTDEFGPGFQDNIFSLLYGERGPVCGNVCFVFAGAQELEEFRAEGTSPLATRASSHLVRNLSTSGIEEFVANRCSVADVHGVVEQLIGETGGHAGLTAHFLTKLAGVEGATADDVEQLAPGFRRSHGQLLRLWARRLSAEARVLQEALRRHGAIDVKGAVGALRSRGLDEFDAERGLEELEYTGVVVCEGSVRNPAVAKYWDLIADHSDETSASEQERGVWAEIESLELQMRQVVREQYEGEFGASKSIKMMKAALGADAWTRIEDNRARREKQYPRTTMEVETYILDYSYLGQLGQLMWSNLAWKRFKRVFRDKREVQDLVSAIAPVRSDEAHFRSVPERELQRCRLACNDLTYCLSKIEM